MARTATLFLAASSVGTAIQQFIAAPAAGLNLVRHVHVNNGSASAATFTMAMVSNSTIDSAATRVFDALSIAANSVYDWYAYLVLDSTNSATKPGVLNGKSGTSAALTAEASGEALTAG